jgi:hypothetical protein
MKIVGPRRGHKRVVQWPSCARRVDGRCSVRDAKLPSHGRKRKQESDKVQGLLIARAAVLFAMRTIKKGLMSHRSTWAADANEA